MKEEFYREDCGLNPDWKTIPVPSVWQMHGYDRHQYTNVNYVQQGKALRLLSVLHQIFMPPGCRDIVCPVRHGVLMKRQDARCNGV